MKTLIIILSAITLTITLAAPPVLAGVDRCLSLDGDGDYVDLGQGTFDTLDDFTIEMWVRLNEYKNHAGIFYGGNLDAGMPAVRISEWERRTLNFQVIRADGEDNGLWGLLMLSVGQWLHFAAVLDKTDSEIALYLNGELVGVELVQDIQSFSDFAEAGFILTYLIGHYGDPWKYLDGQIDEARIWSIARSQEEIQDTMYGELEGTEEGLVGYWKFNEAGGTIAYDSSPNGNNGALVGDAYFARKVFVSPDGSDITGDGTAENPYQTIQTGIFNTPTGGMVMVTPGVYVENFTLANGIIVQGAGIDETTVMAESGDVVTANNVMNTTLSGFTIDGGGSASSGIHCLGATASTRIVNNVVVGATTGIQCSESASPLIKYNTIQQNLQNGINCEDSSNPTIEYNIIKDNKVTTDASRREFIGKNDVFSACVRVTQSLGGGKNMKDGVYKLAPPSTPEEWQTYHDMRRKILWENRRRFGGYDENHPDEFLPDNHPMLLFFRGNPVGVVRIDIVRDENRAIMRRVAIKELEQRK
ncbi:MAG: LamG-like jellyroll fold domain-containing protein, partial [Candidatus Poribacteria bacterium]